jgi:predicted nuclease of predicted toxin-antitoxin system
MKILLDECIPRKLKFYFPEYECQTGPEAGLANQKNGVLLSLAEKAGFQLFFTMDKGFEYQQNLAGRSIAILIVRARSNRLQDLLPHVEMCRSIMTSIRPGELIRIGEEPSRRNRTTTTNADAPSKYTCPSPPSSPPFAPSPPLHRESHLPASKDTARPP